MLDFTRNGPGTISTSKLRLAQFLPVPFENPVEGGCGSLNDGAWFRQLCSVPMADGGKANLTRLPAREGFERIAVVFPDKKFVWFSLKKPKHLASTVL